jgi:hypothetical protein
MMKLWQTPLKEAPSKGVSGGGRKNKERGPKSHRKEHNIEWVSKGHQNKSYIFFK